ncbi:MAG: DUF480 domain-containing protein [Tahibacter sp.]
MNDSDSETESEQQETPGAPQLDRTEARILGSLVEKAATTPEVYPLTLNAVVSACNQKSNRDPLLELEPGAVGHALRQLEGRGFVAGSMSARASRYEHRLDQALGITPRQRAVLAIMLLRGPQTISELLTRTERLSDFGGLDDVRGTIDRLMNRTPTLVVRISRSGGQREDRYMHLLCGPVSGDSYPASSASAAAPLDDDIGQRVAQLEQRLIDLQQTLDSVLERLNPQDVQDD